MIIATKTAKKKDGYSGEGEWDLYKFFYEGEKGEYGEFYLNFNRKKGQAELVTKDVAYAGDLVKAIADCLYEKEKPCEHKNTEKVEEVQQGNLVKGYKCKDCDMWIDDFPTDQEIEGMSKQYEEEIPF
jgi:hypothetical protein